MLALAASGCATTWAITQAADKPQAWDEGVREVRVPQPGIVERLTVTMPLATVYEVPPPAQPGQPPAQPKALAFALACSTDQNAHDVVYHAAFRYGSRWKKGTAIAFLVEGAAAALIYATRDAAHPEDMLYAGFFGIDAIASGALFFAPRKEIYRRDDRPVTTHVRSDCPDGLELAIGGSTFPVDAAGKIGDVGEAALDQWMASGAAPIEVRIAGQARTLELGDGERCSWQRDHHHAPCTAIAPARTIAVTVPVAAGALARE